MGDRGVICVPRYVIPRSHSRQLPTVDLQDDSFALPRAATLYLASEYVERGTSSPATSRTIVLPVDLPARIRARDVGAFRELVSVAHAPLVRFARGLVGTPELAEDVVQDVFAELWEQAERWTPRGNPVTYLFGTVRHRAIDAVRRATSETRRAARVAADIDRHAVPADADVLDAEDAKQHAAHIHALEAFLATLSERQRTAYDLRYRHGMSIAEVAETLGIAVKSGEQLLGRLVRSIRERMRELEPFLPPKP